MRTIIDLAPVASPFGLAVEEVLLQRVGEDERTTVRVWTGKPCIVVGRSQRIEDEVDEAGAGSLGLGIARRMSGGGTVIHYPGNLNVSVVLATREWSRSIVDTFEWIGAAIANGLSAAFDVSVVAEGNRLQIDRAKLGGAAQARRRGAILYHTTMVVSACPAEYIDVLRAHHEDYNPRGVRSQPAPMTSLSDAAGRPVHPLDAARAALLGLQTAIGGVQNGEALSDEERRRATQLLHAKYGHPSWIQ